MTMHVARAEWLAARRELLEREKELTRQRDELARRRRELPWVPVEKPYIFETDDGPKTLAELFRRALTAARLPLHARPGMGGGLPELLVLGGPRSTARSSISPTAT